MLSRLWPCTSSATKAMARPDPCATNTTAATDLSFGLEKKETKSWIPTCPARKEPKSMCTSEPQSVPSVRLRLSLQKRSEMRKPTVVRLSFCTELGPFFPLELPALFKRRKRFALLCAKAWLCSCKTIFLTLWQVLFLTRFSSSTRREIFGSGISPGFLPVQRDAVKHMEQDVEMGRCVFVSGNEN